MLFVFVCGSSIFMRLKVAQTNNVELAAVSSSQTQAFEGVNKRTNQQAGLIITRILT